MKRGSIAILMLALLAGCTGERTAFESAKSVGVQKSTIGAIAEPRRVTLRSHLAGWRTDDPTLHLGETVVVVPDPSEPFSSHDSLRVQLPTAVPLKFELQMYLSGFAIAQSSLHNQKFL